MPLRNTTEVRDDPGREVVVSVNQVRAVNGHFLFDSEEQLANNIREIKLVGLQFRAERPESISQKAIEQWERGIVHFVRQ